MNIRTLTIVLFLLAYASLARAGTASNSLEATVNDHRGKPVAGATLQLERLDVRGPAKTAVSDSTGKFLFQNIATGTYKITALNGSVAGAASIVRAGPNQTNKVKLSLAQIVKSGGPSKKRKHYVWVSEETGTHIGGGRWVEINDDVHGTGSSAVDKRDGQMLTGQQSFQIRPLVPPSQ